jgi:hypothetical protein
VYFAIPRLALVAFATACELELERGHLQIAAVAAQTAGFVAWHLHRRRPVEQIAAIAAQTAGFVAWH